MKLWIKAEIKKPPARLLAVLTILGISKAAKLK